MNIDSKNLKFQYTSYSDIFHQQNSKTSIIKSQLQTMPPKQSSRMNNHFEQNFQQSSANFSESNLQSSHHNQSQQQEEGQAIQLLQIKPNGKVQLNNEALDIIASYNDKPVGFVALVGKYRTGKSFLLNKLLFLDQKGFKVEQYTNACTQGIWMWTNPFINQYLGNYLFFIDTEGLASLQKGQQNDIRIFTLATLISSYIIYNSVGCIDERSISDLQAVTKLSKNIMTEEQMSAQQNQRRLQDFMPGFCWVVRDFTLQLKDQRGRSITPLQYLQKSLTDESSVVRTSEQSKRIKKSLLSLFKDRDCVTLVRPARQQNEIQTLNKLPDVYLRRQFTDGVNVLREKIQRKAGSKMFEGKQLYGNDMACMIEAYAEAINQGRVPTIKSAWQQIVQNEGDMAYAAGHQKYSQLFQTYFSDDQPKQQRQLNKILSRMKQQAIDEFKRNCVSQNDQYSKKLRQWIEKQQETIRQANENASNAHNLEILKQESHGLMKKVQQNYYIGKKQQYFDDLEVVLKNYRQKATGDKKQALLVDFLTATQKIGVNLQKKPQNSYENNQMIVKETQQIMRMKEQANKSRANQAHTTATITKKEEISKQKRTEMKKKKVQQGGCCGGKCQIM